jgi:hypothetical protein
MPAPGEDAGADAGEDAGERRVLARPLPVCVFYGEGDGEVATVGTVAEIREVFSRYSRHSSSMERVTARWLQLAL